MDIAALGLSVDSGPAERAVAALRQLPGAARAAAAGADQLAGSAEREARAITQSTASLNTNARAAQVAGSAVRAANENIARSGGLARHEMINLSRQVQDIGVSLASGQSPFTVLVQQGTQVGDIFANTNGTMRGFASQIASIITPMRLLGVGVLAVGAAVYAGVSYWKSYALALDDLSHITGTATTELSKLQTAASIKGIGQDDFAGGMRRFADAVYEAKAGTNDLSTLLRLNGKTVSDTAGTLDTVAELVRRAKDDQQRLQLLQQAGLPATMEWVRLLRNGAEGLSAAKEEAAKFGGAANDQMVKKAREFDEAWNRAWTNFSVYARASIQTAAEEIEKLNNSGFAKFINTIAKYHPVGLLGQLFGTETGAARLGFQPNKFLSPTEASVSAYGPALPGGTYGPPMAAMGKGATRDLVDLAAQRQALQMEQQRLSLLGDLATIDEKVRLVELQIIQARMQPGNLITKEDMQRIRDYAREQEKVGRLRETVGILGEAATEAQRYAARVGELDLALRANKISQDDFNRALAYANPLFAGAASTLENNLTSGLASIVDGTKSAKDAFRDMSMAIISEINQMIIKLLIVRPLINGLAGGFGGMFGGNSPGAPSNYAGYNMTGLPGSANGNVFSGGNIIPFARGGIVDRATIFPMARGYGLMGEAGPEAVMPLRRGQDGKLGVVAAGSGGPRMVVNVINNAGSDIQARPQSQPRQNSDGSISLDVVIERAVRNAVNSDVANNGPMTQGLARRFNLNSANGLA